MASPIAAVLVHIPDQERESALAWYQKVFPQAQRVTLPEFDFSYLEVEGVALEIVRADEKVGSGAAGSVVYWHTDDFQERLNFLLGLGATLFRGPIDIEDGMKMCQVKDLWGNPMGVRGPASG